MPTAATTALPALDLRSTRRLSREPVTLRLWYFSQNSDRSCFLGLFLKFMVTFLLIARPERLESCCRSPDLPHSGHMGAHSASTVSSTPHTRFPPSSRRQTTGLFTRNNVWKERLDVAGGFFLGWHALLERSGPRRIGNIHVTASCALPDAMHPARALFPL